MAEQIKTDNGNLLAKLDLRRYMLMKYHANGAARVLDCCQGEGAVWNILREEFAIANYWGVDVKRKRGRLKIDSAKILAQPGWNYNVIDIDTYGSPWNHWMAMLPHITQPTTVFLTIGQVNMGTSRWFSEVLGMGGLKVPRAIMHELSELAISALLTRGYSDGIITTEAVEVATAGNARYLSLRLEPKNGDDRNGTPAATSHTRSAKETEHV